MRAIILVGGEGTRLRPLTYLTPKQMLPVAEVPMIRRVVDHLASHGVTDVGLSLGYRPDAFINEYPDGRCGQARLSYAVEPELLDTAGAIRFAAMELGVSDTFLVLNGDVLTDLDFTALVAAHRERGAEGTIALTPVEDPSSFGVVPCDDDGRVQAFIEKPAPGTAPTNLINAGTYVLEKSVIDRIPPGRRVNIERETFPEMVSEGMLYGLAADGYWLDVGTPERYVQASLDVVSGRYGGPVPVTGAVASRHPGVWVLGDVSVDGQVRGPALLGPGSSIGPGATVEGSVLGTAASVEAGAEVAASVLMKASRVGEGAHVSNAIVGPGALIGRDAVVQGWSVIGAGAHVEDGARLDGARHPA